MRLVVYGHSHAHLLASEISKLGLTNTDLVTYCKRGATVSTFPLPVVELSSLSEDDVLVLLPFGNDVLARKIKIEKRPKFIRLLECSPTPQDKLDRLYQSVREVLSSLRCRIYLIDNIYRHTDCKDAFLSFKKQNGLIQKVFSGIPNLTVLDHRKLLKVRHKKLRDRAFYSQILKDNVHLYSQFYREMSQSLAAIAQLF